MKLIRRRFIRILACTASVLPFGSSARSRDDTISWEGFALGASCSVVIAGKHHAQAQALLAAVTAEVERMEALFSLYREDSAVMRLNRTGRLQDPSPDMVRLVCLCGDVHGMTGGKFDPTIQPVWRLLADTGGHADAESLEMARALVGWKKVSVGSRSIAFRLPGMAVTFNGIAQGYATDRVADILRRNGCTNVLVDIGELAAIGEREPGHPWRIGISSTSDGGPEMEIELADMAVATSSPRGTVLDAEGRVSHIVDPQSLDAPRPWRRISVIHPSATLADGLSTAFCLMDRGEIEATASAATARVLLA